jgi:hypothetical protein
MTKTILSILLAVTTLTANAQKSRISLNSDNVEWSLCPQADLPKAQGSKVSTPGFKMGKCVNGIVPGVVFSAYVAAGKEKDPNYGINVVEVNEDFYNRPFWYRTEFNAPKAAGKGQRMWLCFDNINRYADVWVNGKKVSGTASSMRDINGHMLRSRFDVTEIVKPGKRNAVAVLVYDADQKKKRFSKEPFAIGCSPSYLAAAGWDWMPYVPGRLAGITGNAYLEVTGEVQMVDPWVRTLLPTLHHADIEISSEIKNTAPTEKTVTLNGTINPGNVTFSKTVTVAPETSASITLTSEEAAQLGIDNPRLWWPNGYGEPFLYTLNLSVSTDGKVSDNREIKFGIKKYEYAYIDNKVEKPVLTFYINGQKLFPKGGSWGMSEWLLRCHGAQYEEKIKLHTEQNFNMIRCWTGCVTDDEFYEYCDKYGIMVWDDFWIHAGEGEIIEPDAFKANALDKVKRLRNHPCIALWCGANETHPVEDIDSYLRKIVAEYDHNDRHYKSCSNQDGLSGSGPWANRPPRHHFETSSSGLVLLKPPYPYGIDHGYGMRSELGMGTMPNYESVKLFIPEDKLWPLPTNDEMNNDSNVWNVHYFGKNGSNADPGYYKAAVTDRYGASNGIEEYCAKAQYINLEDMKGMYEAWNDKMWEDASGILIWMSLAAYPSCLWQTFDYYYDATGSYFGAKQACEPVHIQWNSLNNSVKVINSSPKDLEAVHAKATIYDINGKELPNLGMEKTLYVRSADKAEAFRLQFPNKNIAEGKPCKASSVMGKNTADGITDGSLQSRWESEYSDPQWVYVDLQEVHNINSVQIFWEGAYSKEYEVQTSTDAENWTTVHVDANCDGGIDFVKFAPADARYVRIYGKNRSSWFGHSVLELKVFDTVDTDKSGITPLHFIRLQLTDSAGNLLSDNFYWRNGVQELDYSDLQKLPKADIRCEILSKDAAQMKVRVSNNSSTVAFGNRLRLVNSKSGERVLPAPMSDNYFTLMPNESRDITIKLPSEGTDGGVDLLLKQFVYDEEKMTSVNF